MVLKWINSLKGHASNESIMQGANEENKKIKKIEGKDIAHEVLTLRARDNSIALGALMRSGSPQMKREKFKSCVKKQVFEIVSGTFKADTGCLAEDITEEITEQIVSAADFDPTYKDLFDEEA